MNWILFQLLFDIILFAFIIYVVVLISKQKRSSAAELRELLSRFDDVVTRGEAVARELNRDPAMRGGGGLSPSAAKPAAQQPSRQQGFFPDGDGSKIDGHKRKIAALKKHGLSSDEISRRLAIPLPEVELIVAMLEGGE